MNYKLLFLLFRLQLLQRTRVFSALRAGERSRGLGSWRRGGGPGVSPRPPGTTRPHPLVTQQVGTRSAPNWGGSS